MKLKTVFLTLTVCFGLLAVSSCSDDSSSTTNPTTETKITFASKTISGKLKQKKLDVSGSYTMVDWSYGACTMALSTSVSENVATCQVSASGDFSLVLPREIESKYFLTYYQLLTGIKSTPTTLTNAGPYLLTVNYKIQGIDMPGIVKIATFKNNDYSNSGLLKLHDIDCFNEAGTMVGTSANGNLKYNFSVTKGWNFIQYGETNGTTEFSTISELPSNVIFHL